MRYVLRILGLTVLSLEVEQDESDEDDQPVSDNDAYVNLDADTGLSPGRNFGFGSPFTTHEYDWNAD